MSISRSFPLPLPLPLRFNLNLSDEVEVEAKVRPAALTMLDGDMDGSCLSMSFPFSNVACVYDIDDFCDVGDCVDLDLDGGVTTAGAAGIDGGGRWLTLARREGDLGIWNGNEYVENRDGEEDDADANDDLVGLGDGG